MDIGELCKKAGMTRKQLGDLVGVKQPTVSLWKNGVPPKHVAVVSKATGIPPSEIRPDIFRIE